MTNQLKVKIKKLHPDAIIPKYAHSTDAGLDLTAVSIEYSNGVYTYGTGLSIEIPEGYVGLIFPRSSCYKQELWQTNSVGVIDSGYRGEIKFKFKNVITRMSSEEWNMREPSIWQVGDRIGQLIIIPYPSITLEEVEDLSTSDRQDGGFGSTGN